MAFALAAGKNARANRMCLSVFVDVWLYVRVLMCQYRNDAEALFRLIDRYTAAADGCPHHFKRSVSINYIRE